MLDRIDYNMNQVCWHHLHCKWTSVQPVVAVQTVQNTDNGLRHVKRAEEYQKKSGTLRNIIGGLVAANVIVIGIIALRKSLRF
jgi:hypothetical protein